VAKAEILQKIKLA